MGSIDPTIVAARVSAWSRVIRRTAVIAAVGLLVARVLPPDGIGAPVCTVRAFTGVPCPGCGLTRATSCAVRGMLRESASHHPLGLVLVGAAIVVLALCLVPDARRRAWLTPLATRIGWVRVAFAVVTTAGLAFGVIRAVRHAVTG